MKYEYILLLEDFSELKIGSKSILNWANLILKSKSLQFMENNVWASVPKGSKVTGPKGFVFHLSFGFVLHVCSFPEWASEAHFPTLEVIKF